MRPMPHRAPFAAATVDFPHCREQFRMPRFASDSSTAACTSSGANPRLALANSAAPGMTLVLTLAGFRISATFHTTDPYHKPPKFQPLPQVSRSFSAAVFILNSMT